PGPPQHCPAWRAPEPGFLHPGGVVPGPWPPALMATHLLTHSPWPSGVAFSLEMPPRCLRAPGSFSSIWVPGATAPTCSSAPTTPSFTTHPLSSTAGRRAWRCPGTSQPPTCCKEAFTATPSTPRCTWTPGARTRWSCLSTMWSPWSSSSPPMPSG
ncbi:unnamed protein product, partial [Gulo gulo]